MTEYWFKPKRHGYGATPSHWKGWLVTIAFTAVVSGLSLVILLSLTEETRTVGLIAWTLAVAAAVWAFMEFVKKKTDGPWLWRFNGKSYRSILLGDRDE